MYNHVPGFNLLYPRPMWTLQFRRHGRNHDVSVCREMHWGVSDVFRATVRSRTYGKHMCTHKIMCTRTFRYRLQPSMYVWRLAVKRTLHWLSLSPQRKVENRVLCSSWSVSRDPTWYCWLAPDLSEQQLLNPRAEIDWTRNEECLARILASTCASWLFWRIHVIIRVDVFLSLKVDSTRSILNIKCGSFKAPQKAENFAYVLSSEAKI